MDDETIKFILKTRMKTAEMNGNYAEQAFMKAVLEKIEENDLLKGQLTQGDE